MVTLGGLQCPDAYGETSAGAAQRKAAMTMLALANHLDLEMATADVSSAFLYAELEEELYVQSPDKTYARLLKSLYGLKQAAKCFEEVLKSKLHKLGFKSIWSDKCAYIMREGGHYTICCTHVDDILFVSSCKALMDRLIKGGVDAHGTTKPGLQDELDISFDKEGLNYLGINICRDRDNKIMKLSQFGYISKAIASFPLNNPSRPAMNPYLRDKLSQAPDKDDNLNPIAQELYQSLTGTLLYLAIGTRPDILCSVHDRTRKTQQATNRDLYAAQRILRYIMHTYDRRITFDGQQPLEVFGYADSTFQHRR